MTKEFMDRAWRDIDLAARDELGVDARASLDATIARLKEKSSLHPDAEVLYALGYACYVHPDRLQSPRIRTQLVDALTQVLQLEQQHALARLYLGHHAYDLADYAQATHHFRLVDVDALDAYMRARAIEMRACCEIRLHGLAHGLDSFESFVRATEQLPPEDIFPTNLAKALEQSDAAQIDAQTQTRLHSLASRLDERGHFGMWFSEIVQGLDSQIHRDG